MPNSITIQPTSGKVVAAYRPILFTFRADISTGISPVAYCDIYFGGVFYKTISKTQYIAYSVGAYTDYIFDIQDAVQEYLGKYIAPNGGYQILDSGLIVSVFCKFRSSSLDINGFLISNGLAPSQATGQYVAVSGGGIQSNTFSAINATLQHEDNQELSSHLNSFKTGTWNALVYPVTHRHPGCRINKEGSDYFPILVNDAAILPSCLTLHYRLKNSSNWLSASSCYDVPVGPCVAPFMASFTLPDALEGSAYSQSAPISVGTAPFTLSGITKPDWMTVAISGSSVTFTGLPTGADVGVDIPVNFTVNNACGSSALTKDITVIASGACVNVSGDVVPVWDNITVGQAVDEVLVVLGTQPFVLTINLKPSWMTISLVGDTVYFTGVPDAAVIEEIDITITNCSAGSYNYNVIFTVEMPADGTNIRVTNTTIPGSDKQIDYVSPVFYFINSGAYPVVSGQALLGVHNGFTGMIEVGISGPSPGFVLHLRLHVNGVNTQTKNVVGGTALGYPTNYIFTSDTYSAGDSIIIQLE